MPEKIRVQCTSCFATLAVPDSAAGKKIRCPKCQGVVSVPEDQPSAPNQGKSSSRDADALSQSSWQTEDSYDNPSMDESDEADWGLNDQYGSSASMGNVGKADRDTDKYSQVPPPLPSRNRSAGDSSRMAPIPKRKEDRRELPDLPFTAKPSHRRLILIASLLFMTVVAGALTTVFMMMSSEEQSDKFAELMAKNEPENHDQPMTEEGRQPAEESVIAEEAGVAAKARAAEEMHDQNPAEASAAKKQARVTEAATRQAMADDRIAAEAKAAEESHRAEEARILAEAELAEESRILAEAELAEEARILAEAELAEEARILAEAELAEEAQGKEKGADQTGPSPVITSGQFKGFADSDQLAKGCDMCSTPREALILIAEYKSQRGLDGSVESSISRMEAQWQDRFTQGLVRVGTKWGTVEDQRAAILESQVLVEEAVTKIRGNDVDGARKDLQKASKVDKNSYLANYLLGLYFALQNNCDEASGNFTEVLARSPRHTGAMNNLAVCDVKNGKVSTAITRWEVAAEMAPTSPEIIHNLGRCVFEFERKRITAKQSVVNRFRVLYGQLTQTSESVPQHGFWLLTPAVAPSDSRPKNGADNGVANVVKLGSEGSGFFVAPNLILTNRHVVEHATYGMADAVQVSVPAGAQQANAERAEVIAVSDVYDLALLRCQALNLPPLLFSDKGLSRGQEVLSIGYQNIAGVFDLGPVSTQAKVAFMIEKCPDTVLCDVAMNSGNSGGPLLDTTGRVAGINSTIFLLKRGVSGGVQANAAISFLKKNIPDMLAPRDEPNESSWSEIESAGAASIVFIEVVFHDAVPVLATQKGIRMQGSYFVDDSCLRCKGTGRVPCPLRVCLQGLIREQSFRTEIIGTRGNEREVQIPTFKQVDCKNCERGAVVCPTCNGSGKD